MSEEGDADCAFSMRNGVKRRFSKPCNSLIFAFLFYLSTQRIKLRVEHLNILQTSSCDVSSVK